MINLEVSIVFRTKYCRALSEGRDGCTFQRADLIAHCTISFEVGAAVLVGSCSMFFSGQPEGVEESSFSPLAGRVAMSLRLCNVKAIATTVGGVE